MTQPESPDLSFDVACVIVELFVAMNGVFAKQGIPADELYRMMSKNVRDKMASTPRGEEILVAIASAAVVRLAQRPQVS